MRRGSLDIRSQSPDYFLALFNLRRKVFQQTVFQPEMLAHVVCFQHLQPGHFNIQIHFFFNLRISGA